MNKKVTWVVVADHQRGRVLSSDGPGLGLYPVEDMSFATHLATDHQLVTARLPRSQNSTGGARHAIEPRVDPHRQEGERFIDTISSAIAAAATQRRFDWLVLIAPPRALGELRKALPEKVQQMVIGEIDSDLTRAPAETVRERVGEFMAP